MLPVVFVVRLAHVDRSFQRTFLDVVLVVAAYVAVEAVLLNNAWLRGVKNWKNVFAIVLFVGPFFFINNIS